MTNLSLWRMASGLDVCDSFIDLPVSPHYWKPKTLSVIPLEGLRLWKVYQKGNIMLNWKSTCPP